MKTFALGEKQYRIREIEAEDGSFLALKLTNKLRQILSEEKTDETPQEEVKKVDKEEAIRGTISLILMNLDEDTYKTVQQKALALVDEIQIVGEKEAFIPILRNGKVILPELKANIQQVIELTFESLFYNLSPFFSENGLKLLMTGKA